MLALTVEQAKMIGLGTIAVLVVGAVLAAWLLKQVVQKVLLAVVLVGLAVVVWTQRADVQDCADRLDAQGTDATCTFFGRDVTLD